MAKFNFSAFPVRPSPLPMDWMASPRPGLLLIPGLFHANPSDLHSTRFGFEGPASWHPGPWLAPTGRPRRARCGAANAVPTPQCSWIDDGNVS